MKLLSPRQVSLEECGCEDCDDRLDLIRQMYEEADSLSKRQRRDQIFTAADLNLTVNCVAD